MYTVSDIRIAGYFTVRELLSLTVEEKLNHHTKLTYSGFIGEARAQEITRGEANRGTMSFFLADELIFSGIPLDVKIEHRNRTYTLTVTCVSYSYLLDVNPLSASFQDASSSHTEVLGKLYKENGAGKIIFREASDFPTGRPIIKYRETDWWFTLRMAAITGNVVYPYSQGEFPGVYFGVLKTGKQLPERHELRHGYDTSRCLLQGGPGKPVSLPKYLYMRFKADNSLALGDQVIAEGEQLIVCEKIMGLNGGILEISYLLSGILPLIPEEETNPHLAGLTLSGRVIDTASGKVKLHLDIDREQNPETAFWFDYKPATGNVFQPAQLLGTTALLKMDGGSGSSAVVSHVIHKNAGDVEDMGDYNRRFFTTEFRKRMAMVPDMLYFASDKNSLVLADATGVAAKSTGKFEMSADGDITITSKRRVRLSTLEKLYVTQDGTKSGIDMSGREIHIKSPGTRLVSLTRKGASRSMPGLAGRPAELPPVEMSDALTLNVASATPFVLRPRRQGHDS